MKDYIDGFVFPIPRIYLDEYRRVAEKIAKIWKEHGAVAYYEYLGDDLFLEGTQSFIENLNAKEDEVIIFGWVVFPSKEIRNMANKKVPEDPRMEKLLPPLTDPEKMIFNGSRMLYGGFKPLIQSTD